MALNDGKVDLINDVPKANYIDLARFIAIYAVVLGHFAPFVGNANEWGRELLYMFHVPIFFVVSGMLSKPTSMAKAFFSLMVPYFIYNVISILKFDFVALFTIDALELNNSPTWFFPALFCVKVVGDKISKGVMGYAFMIIVLITTLDLEEVEIPRIFGLHAILYALPFFLIGKYLKGKLSSILSFRFSIAIIAMSCLWIPYVFATFNRFDMYSSQIHNPLVYFLTSILASLSVLIICNKAFGYIPKKFYDFIYVNSRGTMFILGTHYIVLGAINKYIMGGSALPFGVKILIVCLSTIPYYYVIRYTYNKLPILYGKVKKRV